MENYSAQKQTEMPQLLYMSLARYGNIFVNMPESEASSL